jgi:serine/threonine-protein kinase
VALSRTEEIGRVLAGRYRIIAPIGRGASAQVFLADDVRLRRRVAVKMLHDALADDAAFLRRFQAEARAAAALNHPNVMAVYDWGQEPDGDVPFLVLEYLAGGSLRSMLDRGDHLTPSQALLVGLEATRALEYAHRRGFVHRDIKPANILFGDEGRLRIADFGLARALAEAAWTEPQGAVLGTARYASPEQAQGKALDGKADVYSLALVLVESVTGQVPFTADTTIGTLMARVNRDLEVPEELGTLRAALTRAGLSDPAARLDAHDLAVGLMAAAGDMPRPAPLPLAGAVEVGEPADDSDPTMLAAGPARATVAEPDRTVVESDRTVDAPATTPGTGPDDDDLEVWPFLNVTAAVPGAPRSPASPVEDDVELDLTRIEPSPAPSPSPATVAAAPAPLVERDDVADPPERRRRSWKRWALVGFVLALLVAVGVSAGALVADLTATPTHQVPAVKGLDVDAAREKLAADHWKIAETRIRQDGTDPGEVLDVVPKVGESVREGETVRLIVSNGPTIADVPRGMSGKTATDAVQLVERAGFVAKTTPAFDEAVPAGRVISVAKGTKLQLPKGETVGLVISQGPEPRTIPDGLTGKTLDEVTAILGELRLSPKPDERYSDEVAKGVVMGTDPGAGAKVERGAEVKVVVSKGRKPVPVPDISGAATLGEAVRILEANRLQAGTVSGPAAGRPARTDPPAGTLVPPGSTVNLILRGKGGG